jgi:hypothetical protein
MVGFRSFPVFMFPDNSPQLKLNKKEQAEMVVLNTEAETIAQRRLDIVRGAARRLGIIADKMEDLKSESGNPFVEDRSRIIGLGENGYRAAVVRGYLGSVEEAAYLCEEMYSSGGGGSGCRWVKGNPQTENYDNIGALSGSAGVNYYCKICGQLIGRDVNVRSLKS